MRDDCPVTMRVVGRPDHKEISGGKVASGPHASYEVIREYPAWKGGVVYFRYCNVVN